MPALTTKPKVRSEGHYFPTLDGWRALAVTGVILYHATPSHSLLYPVSSLGFHGVRVFFGISGFLICSRLLEERERKGRIDLRNFYIRRAFRILPPALTYLLIVAVLAALGFFGGVARQEWLSCVFFYRNYLVVAGGVSVYTGHFWSLSVEEHFYFLLPGLLVLFGPRMIRWGVVLLAAAVTIWRYVDGKLSISTAALAGSFDWQHTDKCIDALLWGCFLALVLRNNATREKLAQILSVPVWVVLLILYFATCTLLPPLAATIEAVLVPLLLAGTVLRPNGGPAWFLELPVIRWVGRLSYSLYLWQALFCVARYRSPTWAQTFPFNIALLLLLASLSYYGVERPMISVGRRLTKRKQLPELESTETSPALA